MILQFQQAQDLGKYKLRNAKLSVSVSSHHFHVTPGLFSGKKIDFAWSPLIYWVFLGTMPNWSCRVFAKNVGRVFLKLCMFTVLGK